MKQNQLPFPQRLLLPLGLLMTTLPLLFKEYIHLSDFFRGLLAGGGISLEIAGAAAVLKQKRCMRQAGNGIKQNIDAQA